jgi:hypothetical protein
MLKRQKTPPPSERQRRLPDRIGVYVDAARETSEAAAEELQRANSLIDQAIACLLTKPNEAERLLLYAARLVAEDEASHQYIQRMLVQCRLGR